MYVNMKISQSELEKMRQKYIKINTNDHNLWKFTSPKIHIHNIHRGEVRYYLGDDVNCISWIAFSKPAFYFLISNNANSRTNQ